MAGEGKTNLEPEDAKAEGSGSDLPPANGGDERQPTSWYISKITGTACVLASMVSIIILKLVHDLISALATQCTIWKIKVSLNMASLEGVHC